MNVETLIEAARRHGPDSDPDREARDLQGLLRAAWELMNPARRAALLASQEAEDLLDVAGGR